MIKLLIAMKKRNHNHRSNVLKIEVTKAVQTFKITAKNTELGTYL